MAKTLPRTAGVAAHSQSLDDVRLSQEVLFDVYKGNAHALIACGIVEFRQLPGQPGDTKMCASFDADGTRRRPGCSSDGWRQEGAKQIKRMPSGRFEVKVAVSDQEKQKRRAKSEIESAATRAHSMAEDLIRRASLSSTNAFRGRKHPLRNALLSLRLVWSAAN